MDANIVGNHHDWQWLKQYCEERLDDVRKINENCLCPSAFVCIAAFLGFLSRIAYGTNNKNNREDGKCFRDFITNFMSSKYHGHESMMYSTFRCGIIHAMSFDDELTVDNASFLKAHPRGVEGVSQLAITHNRQYSFLCTGSQLQKDQETGMYVLVADVLCDDIASAINTMFSDASVRQNGERFIKCQRPITAVSNQFIKSDQEGSDSISYETDVQSGSDASTLSASHSETGSQTPEHIFESVIESNDLSSTLQMDSFIPSSGIIPTSDNDRFVQENHEI